MTPADTIIAAILNLASVLKKNPQEQHLTQIKMNDLTRLQKQFHETNINPITTQDGPPPLIQANVTTPRVSPRRTTTTAPQEKKLSPRVSNTLTF